MRRFQSQIIKKWIDQMKNVNYFYQYLTPRALFWKSFQEVWVYCGYWRACMCVRACLCVSLCACVCVRVCLCVCVCETGTGLWVKTNQQGEGLVWLLLSSSGIKSMRSTVELHGAERWSAARETSRDPGPGTWRTRGKQSDTERCFLTLCWATERKRPRRGRTEPGRPG